MSEPDDPSPPTAIARLEAEGELVVDQGQFTLDAAAARTKLADFRLAERHAWVLLVVEAGELLPDARKIEFEIDNATTRVRLIGASLDAEDLRRLFDAVFAERGSAAVEARRRLAIASHTAAGLDDRLVEIRSRDLTLVLDGDETREQASPSADGPSPLAKMIEIVVRDTALGARLSSDAAERERELLRLRACFAQTPVELDGEQISAGFRLHGCLGQRRFGPRSEPSRARGVIGWDCLATRTGIYLVADGVIVEVDEGRDWQPNIVALVDASGLRRDLSLSRFVRDAELEGLIEQAQAAHDAFDLGALELPLVSGKLPPAGGAPVRFQRRSLIACLVSIALIALIISVHEALGFGLGLLLVPVLGFVFSIISLAVASQQLSTDNLSTAAAFGDPGVAELLAPAKVIRELGPVSQVQFDARVSMGPRLPRRAGFKAYIPTDQLDRYGRGQWLWVHRYQDVVYLDAKLSPDRPARAIARAHANKALPPG